MKSDLDFKASPVQDTLLALGLIWVCMFLLCCLEDYSENFRGKDVSRGTVGSRIVGRENVKVRSEILMEENSKTIERQK